MLVVTTPATSDSSSSQRKWVWAVLIMILLLGGGAYAVWRALNKAPPPSPSATPSPTPDPGPQPGKEGFLEYQGLVSNPSALKSPSCAPSSQPGTSDQCKQKCIDYFEKTCNIDFPDTQVGVPKNARYSAATYDNTNQTCSCYSMTISDPLDVGEAYEWCVDSTKSGASWVNYQLTHPGPVCLGSQK